MDGLGKRWTIQDRDNNSIYLTQKRGEHIVERHPEMDVLKNICKRRYNTDAAAKNR